MVTIVENVVYQHAENVCALWSQRHSAVLEPHYSFSDLVHLDNRVEANLDGLRIAGNAVWPIIDEFVSGEDAGALFTKSVLTLEHGDIDSFLGLVESLGADREALQETQAALAWVHAEKLAHVVKNLLTSSKPSVIELGLTACAAHHRPAINYIENSLLSQDPELRATAMRVVGALGLVDLQHRLTGLTEWETDREKFECASAMAYLGNQSAAGLALQTLAISDSLYSTSAVNCMMMLSNKGSAKAVLKSLDEKPGRERDVVRGFGYLGDPVAVDWLISKTEFPDLCRLAGGSISMITGVDLAESDLETLDEPEGFVDPGPNDNPDHDNVALDEDEDLPWPDTNLIRKWWNSSAKLPAGKFYLDGREKIDSELRVVLRDGYQRQRNAAAVSLALLKPDAQLYDTLLPTNKQKTWIN